MKEGKKQKMQEGTYYKRQIRNRGKFQLRMKDTKVQNQNKAKPTPVFDSSTYFDVSKHIRLYHPFQEEKKG